MKAVVDDLARATNYNQLAWLFIGKSSREPQDGKPTEQQVNDQLGGVGVSSHNEL